MSLLHYCGAAYEDTPVNVSFLVERGAEVDARNQVRCMHLTECSECGMQDERTPLHMCALHGNAETAELLVNLGALRDAVDKVTNAVCVLGVDIISVCPRTGKRR